MRNRRIRRYTITRLKGRPSLFSSISITNWLILINVLFFMIFFIPMITYPKVVENIALRPSSILQGKYLWTLITSMFMHGNFIHLFVNMVSLFFIGNFVERLIGRKRFLAFYLIAGLIAALFFILLSAIFNNSVLFSKIFGSADSYAVGASGALFGLGGLLAILTPRLPVLVFFILPMPIWIAMIFILGLFWVLSVAGELPIGNSAHLGGLIAGLVYALYLKIKYKRKTRLIAKYFR